MSEDDGSPRGPSADCASGRADAPVNRVAALTDVYLTNYASLVRTAALLVSDPAEAEDLVQEAYVHLI